MSRRTESFNPDTNALPDAASFLASLPGTFAHFALQYGHTEIEGKRLRVITSSFFKTYPEAWKESQSPGVVPNQEVVYVENNEAHADAGYVKQVHLHK